AGDDIAVDVDGAEVDGGAQHLERAGLDERVVEADADEVAVQAGGEADGVLIPVQDVERRRLLAEVVVVDDVVPDHVVRAQPGEHAGQRLAVEVAAAGRLGERGGRRAAAGPAPGGA